MSCYALGIDCGNTAIKAALFDASGHEIGAVANNYPTHIPAPGYTEANLQQCWQLCVDAIRRVIEKTGVEAAQIKAIGCSGHGNGLYLLDAAQQPLLAIKSLDNRAAAEVTRLQASSQFTDIDQRNRQGVWSSQTATLLHWLKQHQPERYQQIGQVLFCKDYLNFCLTGECSTEWGDLTASGLFDFERDCVSEQLLQGYGIADIESKLPPVRNSSDIVGAITDEVAAQTGLTSGTPVIAGLFDVVACAYGSDAASLGDVSIVAGTWSINQLVTDTLPPPEVFMTCKMGEQRYLAIESSTCSASNLEWLVQRFFSDQTEQCRHNSGSIFDQFNQQLEQLDIEAGLPIFHPYLYGATNKQMAGANLFGVAGWHEAKHIVYAFYEGVVFAHLEHIQRLRQCGYQISTVSMSGGASRSDYWCQLFADALDVQIMASQCDEVGAKGAAMLALSRVLEPLAEVNELASCDHGRQFSPQKQRHALLSQRYQKYLAIRDCLAQL